MVSLRVMTVMLLAIMAFDHIGKLEAWRIRIRLRRVLPSVAYLMLKRNSALDCPDEYGIACKTAHLDAERGDKLDFGGTGCNVTSIKACINQKREFSSITPEGLKYVPLPPTFENYDTNNDKKISFEEFSEQIQPRYQMQNPKDLSKMFTSADVDGDGVLDPDEFSVAPFIQVTPQRRGEDVQDENGASLSRETKTGKFDCCFPEKMKISLQDDIPVVSGRVPFINVMEMTNGINKSVCDSKILLNAAFLKYEPNDTCQGCTNIPKCGNKMLRIDLFLESTMTGFSFHVGDSRSNNGWKGDAATQGNDAEFHSTGYQHLLYGSDKCPAMALVMSGLLSPGVASITIFVGNEYIRVTNNLGYVYEHCSKCLFALNGQSDSEGPVNEDIFIGLNRIISSSSYRVGTGVCSAVISWACPWG